RMGQFTKLQVWRKAHALALNVYRIAVAMRSSNNAPLRTQMIRAAMSIPTNIVEGRSQASDRDFCRFLRYALNSASELEYHLTLGRDIQAITLTDARSLLDQTIEVIKMLRGLINSVSKTEKTDAQKPRSVPM
ncbi:MAG: four helix bundle protein, partial [Gemmatimonadaceae bacterium]